MKEKDKKIIDIIIKVILIIIIIILLIHNCELIKNKNNKKIPTGNVDIIDIQCDKYNTCIDSNDPSTNKKVIENNESNTKETSKFGEDDVIIEPGQGMIVYDKDIKWNGQVNAKIFTNSMYELEDVIAPESENTYQFIVRNSTKYKLKYEINFIEMNPHNINMKYKLKKNNNYVIDHYVSADEVNLNNYLLNSNENDTYYLEWKWVSSNNDTKVGKTKDAKYSLKIEVKAESTNG